jgi:hypothetical protein
MTISIDDVKWAYNLVFLRDPETEAICVHWSSTCDSVRELIEIIQRSAEAVSLRDAALQRRGLYDLSVEGMLREFALHRSELYDLSPKIQSDLLPILRRLAPYATPEFKKVRMGRDHDGGYIMLDKLEEVEAAYSLGINDDVSWDEDIARRGIPVFQYDHTIDDVPAKHDLFRWFKIGIEGVESGDRSLDTLANLIVANGHEKCRELVLKCDIEGHEWSMLANAPLDLLAAFSQIVIELHFTGNFRDESYIKILSDAMEKLTIHHKVIHVHANNCSPYLILGGVPLPCALELTLIRTEDVHLELSSDVFPTELDMANSPNVVDYRLGSFRF